MNKNEYKPIQNNSKYVNSPNIPNNFRKGKCQIQAKVKNFKDELEFFSPRSSQERPGRIIHQSTEQSIDKKGNHVFKKKTVREIGINETQNKNIKQSKNNISSKNSQVSIKNKPNESYYWVSKYSKTKNESEKQKALYSSPDFQGTSSYDSPIYIKNIKNFNDFDDMGNKVNYKYQSKNNYGKNLGTYTQQDRYEYIKNIGKLKGYDSNDPGSTENEIVSPLGYMGNYSSGSEFDEIQMRSIDNYYMSGRNENKYYNQTIKNINRLNYEMEDLEGFDYLKNNELNERSKYNKEFKKTQNNLSRSDYKKKIYNDLYRSEHLDFQSPDRNIDNTKRFRNVTVAMIDSKGPTNEDRKVTKIMTTKTENIPKTKVYKNKKGNLQKNDIKDNLNDFSKIEAAKIIQAWWRRRYIREEEIYNLTVKNAIKLQSFIRGFLVRKKVLRYITLAIYYQSFCDKLQDVLCNNIKKQLFKFLKEKFYDKIASETKAKNKRLSKKSINLNYMDTKTNDNQASNENIVRKSKDIIQQQNKPQNISQNKNFQTIKTSYEQSSTRTNHALLNNPSPLNYSFPLDYSKKNKVILESPNYEIEKIINNNIIIHRNPNTYYQNKNSKNYYYDNKMNRSYNKIDREIIKNDKFFNKSIINNHPYNYNIYNKIFEERNISPEFGTMKQNKTSRNILKFSQDNSINLSNRKKLLNKTINHDINKISNTIKRTKKNIKKTEKIKNMKKILNNNKKNEIISGGTLSIVKLPNRKINNSESVDVYTHIKKKRININDNTEKINKISGFIPENNEIDNQLSIGVVKIRPDDYEIKNKRVREEIITYNEPETQELKEIIKEKIIIQKESKPETAEEGNDRQIFDMKISKRVAMSIEASSERKEIIKNEEKQIEIFKNKEKEKNKEIDKYKEKLLKEKIKNKYDSLKRAIRITDYWKKRILKEKFDRFKNNCFSGPIIYEIETGFDFQFTQKQKDKKDCSIQLTTEKVDEGSQIAIKNEDDDKKKIKNFDILKISKNRPLSFEKVIKKKNKIENKITSSKLKILSKIQKEEKGLQAEPWKTEITQNKNNINIINKKAETIEEGSQYIHIENKVGQTKQIQIIQNRPELVDNEIQHEYPDNYVEKDLTIEIKGTRKNLIDSDTQYDKPQTKIIKLNHLNFEGIPKKEAIKKIETSEAECNTFNDTVEQGVNAVVEEEPKPKNIEVKIRTVKRSLHELEIPLLKKIWKRKAFRTFRENCRRPPFHNILGRELLRMAFLRWRFIKGYGPDRYGNAYDRDGNLLYQIKGKVADFEIQQDFEVEKEEQSTQYIPIENVISTLKQFEIGAIYDKKKEPEKLDKSVGNNIKMDEVIEKGESINYENKKKKNYINKISKNNYIEIKKTEKKLKEEGTEMPIVENKITKLEKVNIYNDEYKLRKKNNLRMRELLIKMIYKKMMGDKLTLSDALRKWLKKTLLLLQNDQNDLDKKRRRYASISKAERFTLIEEIKKIESGTEMEIKKNEIEKMPNINVIKNKKMKDSEVNVDIPFIFDSEKMRQKNETKISYESSKKPVILETNKENDINIYSNDYIFKQEIKKGIHHPMTEENKQRVKEILKKIFEKRGTPNSILRKYFTIWYRNARYLTCLDNANIITNFCKRNLKNCINNKRWKKLSKKLVLREKIKIIKSSKIVDKKRNKIIDLIRITRINTVFSKRKYLHYILLCWLVYTRNIIKKRNNIKILYENMLNTYMHMADDIFGNNQKENPSVQDALFEAVDSDKFHTKDLKDVPIAEEYYKNKEEIKRVTTNITYVDKEEKDFDSKEYITYKKFISKYPIKSNNENLIIKKKISKVEESERLKSRGRGRKFRTNAQKEILNKFYDENRNYSKSKKELQKEEKEEKFYEKEDFENSDSGEEENNKTINNKIIKEKHKSYNNLEKETIFDNDKDINKKAIPYSERRKYFGKKINNEDEKEIENEK